MSKVITFSRFFPAYHPNAGQPTYFVEKILNAVRYGWFLNYYEWLIKNNPKLSENDISGFLKNLHAIDSEKSHTIRAGNRWKIGDKFSPRVWSGKPYRSAQIIIAPDIEVKKVWNVEIECTPNITYVMLPTGKKGEFQMLSLGEVAKNDGLSIPDFESWFNPKRGNIIFQGQIICWSENINY